MFFRKQRHLSIASCLLLVALTLCDAHDQTPRGNELLQVAAADARLLPVALLPNVAHLAKSPASAQLASDFLAAEERQRRPLQQLGNNNFLGAAQQAQLLRSKTIESALASELPASADSFSSVVPNFRLDEYHPLEEIYDYLSRLAKLRPARVKLFTLGRTAEGRPLKALELVQNSTDPNYVWLDALTHAREWITGSTVLYLIDQIVAGNGGRYNYLVIPVVNPDGYSYTWTTNRMWRKNRSRSADGNSCVGADLNRNYDHPSFGGEGASRDPCSHIFCGPYAFSELETRSIADLMWSLRERIKFYLTIHSYNQLWACPYAHTLDPSPSLSNHMRVLRSIQRAVRDSPQGVHYEIGPLGQSLYVGSGFGIDFAYDKCQIEHSYLVELRDKGAHGFLLPAEQIMPVARETLAGLRAGLRTALG